MDGTRLPQPDFRGGFRTIKTRSFALSLGPPCCKTNEPAGFLNLRSRAFRERGRRPAVIHLCRNGTFARRQRLMGKPGSGRSGAADVWPPCIAALCSGGGSAGVVPDGFRRRSDRNHRRERQISSAGTAEGVPPAGTAEDPALIAPILWRFARRFSGRSFCLEQRRGRPGGSAGAGKTRIPDRRRAEPQWRGARRLHLQPFLRRREMVARETCRRSEICACFSRCS